MADAVDTYTEISGSKRIVLHLLNVSDGTGESAVNKLDISTLTGPDGTAPTSVTLEAVDYDVQGFSSVQLLWDHTTDDAMINLGAGQNVRDFTGIGGRHDPGSAGGTGDVLLTTVGASATATYDIVLVLRLED